MQIVSVNHDAMQSDGHAVSMRGDTVLDPV